MTPAGSEPMTGSEWTTIVRLRDALWDRMTPASQIEAQWKAAHAQLATVTAQEALDALDRLAKAGTAYPPSAAQIIGEVRQARKHVRPHDARRRAMEAPRPSRRTAAVGVAVGLWNIAERKQGRRHSDADVLALIRDADDEFVEEWNPQGETIPAKAFA